MRDSEHELPADRVWLPVSDLASALSAWEFLRRRFPNQTVSTDDTRRDEV